MEVMLLTWKGSLLKFLAKVFRGLDLLNCVSYLEAKVIAPRKLYTFRTSTGFFKGYFNLVINLIIIQVISYSMFLKLIHIFSNSSDSLMVVVVLFEKYLLVAWILSHQALTPSLSVWTTIFTCLSSRPSI